VYEVIRMANENYPRNKIPFPGFTAGACLRKDFGMISEDNPYSDLFLSAWRINEHTPKFLVLQLKKRTELFGKNVVVLGATFKRDSDDFRDSLTPKLIRCIEREAPRSVAVHEPHLGEIIDDWREGYTVRNSPLNEILSSADIVFVALNHSVFERDFDKIYQAVPEGAWFVDIWNVSGNDKIFFQKQSNICQQESSLPEGPVSSDLKSFPSSS
jgi:UDP-N-acetyl-D-mannosaminuronic acid dehydrogenase